MEVRQLRLQLKIVVRTEMYRLTTCRIHEKPCDEWSIINQVIDI